MKHLYCTLLSVSLASAYCAEAQKVFMEGVMVYSVSMRAPDHKVYTGTYSFICKGNKIRKELKLNNGYQDIVLLDCGRNKAVSLQKWNGRKYAIELNMDDIRKKQEPYSDFSLNNEEDNHEKIAGYAVYKGNVSYRDSTNYEVFYTKEWAPSQPMIFEHFPNAHFMPLSFSYTDEHGMALHFEAERIESRPVENAIFRIPPDYKIISNEEYKQMSR